MLSSGGVLASHLLRALPIHGSTLCALCLEGLALAGVVLLPASFPDSSFVCIIAFVSAFQVATFRRVKDFSLQLDLLQQEISGTPWTGSTSL